ncbi:NCA2 family protein [Aspergillus ibericus CBS 121593]|uniref:ATP synthase regulation protein NCA2 n=1 Tax=Aspergillus ibericus CBS 121593 TaxID=1448316 RepID=A0A395GS52_9EURO|nr:ATP synthase regulation protein NCA2 [Aspergillus ibericus CBS 121593]RAK98044.1 ATP synthase regulation protein NCA2 [Aspergillus ibericus CBS 121593]
MYAVNKVYHLDARLDKIQQRIKDNSCLSSLDRHEHALQTVNPVKNVATLERILDSLSITSKSQPMLRSEQVLNLIAAFPEDLLAVDHTSPDINKFLTYAIDSSWLVAAKAAAQTLGIILNTLSEDVLALNEEVIYWDSVSESHWCLGLYMLQTSPVVLWNRLGVAFSTWKNTSPRNKPAGSVSYGWIQLYGIARQCILSPRIYPWRSLLSPLTTAKSEVRQKRKSLSLMMDMKASFIGLLIRKCFSREVDDGFSSASGYGSFSEEWQINVLESVALMKALLEDAANGRVTRHQEESTMAIDQEVTSMRLRYCSDSSSEGPKFVIQQLTYILGELLPGHAKTSITTISNSGRPHYLVRYWLPISFALLSTSTLLELLRNRRHELLRWVADLGSTTIEFWNNWVVDPLRRLIGTIRHDEASEIALMSRNSLEADRASLERMVVDFVLDRCEPSSNDNEVYNTNTITAKVREGDLTPVLKAYEKDLRSPFVGTVRGDLVRALLIQIQKTKVDVEIAIGGIDALLRSQELVFGFIGLTPGILVSYASLRWLYSLFGNRKGLRMGKQQNELRHALRTVHRTLTLSAPPTGGILAFRDYGLLICNAEALLSKARTILRGTDLRSFQEDISDLIDRDRVDRQLRVVERMGWVYSRWL